MFFFQNNYCTVGVTNPFSEFLLLSPVCTVCRCGGVTVRLPWAPTVHSTVQYSAQYSAVQCTVQYSTVYSTEQHSSQADTSRYSPDTTGFSHRPRVVT